MEESARPASASSVGSVSADVIDAHLMTEVLVTIIRIKWSSRPNETSGFRTPKGPVAFGREIGCDRSEEHTSELQSLW
jgi:hypothetical protein